MPSPLIAVEVALQLEADCWALALEHSPPSRWELQPGLPHLAHQHWVLRTQPCLLASPPHSSIKLDVFDRENVTVDKRLLQLRGE